VNGPNADVARLAVLGRRRRLLGLEPIFEGGWLHKGKRARRWNVEDNLFALALFGDVTVDLTQTKGVPEKLAIDAWAILRDVDITVPPGTEVELSGGGFRGHLTTEVPSNAENPKRVVVVHGHTFMGDVTVRAAKAGR
jgi:hypothetical protein